MGETRKEIQALQEREVALSSMSTQQMRTSSKTNNFNIASAVKKKFNHNLVRMGLQVPFITKGLICYKLKDKITSRMVFWTLAQC